MIFETPYVREAIPPSLNQINGVPRKYTNYSDFDIFALPKNLFPYIREIRENLVIEVYDDDYDLLFKDEDFKTDFNQQEKEENRSRYFVKITDTEGDDPFLNEVEKERVKMAIQEVCSHTHGRNLVFVMSYQSVVFSKEGKRIPTAWLNGMLPYVPLTKVKPIFHVKRGLYVILDPLKDYEGIYGRIYEKIISWFQSQYQLGVIPAVFTSTFVEDWDLVQEKQFFRPRRINPAVMGEDPVEFFTERIICQENSLDTYIWVTPLFTEDEIYFIEKLLMRKRYDYTIEAGRFNILLSGYQEAKNLSVQFLSVLDIDEEQFKEFTHEMSLCRV